jgi:hypothetical protein
MSFPGNTSIPSRASRSGFGVTAKRLLHRRVLHTPTTPTAVEDPVGGRLSGALMKVQYGIIQSRHRLFFTLNNRTHVVNRRVLHIGITGVQRLAGGVLDLRPPTGSSTTVGRASPKAMPAARVRKSLLLNRFTHDPFTLHSSFLVKPLLGLCFIRDNP